MSSNYSFTDKAEQTISDAIQLAKDHANAQGTFFEQYVRFGREVDFVFLAVYPLHIAAVLLKDETATNGKQAGPPLFASVIEKAGGEAVSILCFSFLNYTL